MRPPLPQDTALESKARRRASSRPACSDGALVPNLPKRIHDDKPDTSHVPKFLNRLLGMPLRHQDLLFSYFTSIMDSLIKKAS
jgi:hypothetical protein